MEEEQKQETITLKKDTLWKIGAFVFAALFIISLFGVFDFNNGGSGSGTGTGQAVAPTNPPAPTGNVKIPITDADPLLGDENAEVTVVEFSDFQCPFCQRAYVGAVADLKNSNDFKSGEVNFVYKHFPLNSIHPQAQKAAEAAECANRQGKFWEYHDTLFANQGALDVNSLKTYASQIGLDAGKFNKCLDGNEAKGKVSSDLQEAASAGGRGTPYFVIINNKEGKTQTVSGAVPYSNLEAAIDSVR